jgi:hypothetical protein
MERVSTWLNGGTTTSKAVVDNDITLVEVRDEGTPGGTRTRTYALSEAEELAIKHIRFACDLLDVVRAAKKLPS